jgi:hypothetical protein
VSVRQIYDGSDRPDSNSLQRRRSQGRSSDSASTPRRLQSLLIRGGGAPNVHVPLIVGGGHGPTLVVAEAGGTAPERMGESVAFVEAAAEAEKRPRRRTQGVSFPSRARSAPPLSRACQTAL